MFNQTQIVMKKTLLFAFAFAASVMALVSCGKDKKNEEPAVVPSNPLVGTWFRADTENDYFYTFQANGVYQRIQDYYMNGRAVVAHEHIVGDGTYKTDGDVITANIVETTISMDGGPFGPFPDFWPAKEELKFKIEGDKLTLIRDFGTPEESKEVLTKGGKSDKPVDPEGVDVDPADYINTVWRVDSCFAGGEKQRPPHGVIRVLNDQLATFNNDTSAYEFQKGKLTYRDLGWTIVEASKTFAHLQAQGRDLYLCKLPEVDYESAILEPQASDFVGTWKHAFYEQSDHTPNEPSLYYEGSNPWVETWEFQENGTCIYKDWFSGETKTGTWSWEYGLDFLNNPLAYLLVDENDRITVQPITKNWFKILRGYTVPGTSTTEYKYWWFYRVD